VSLVPLTAIVLAIFSGFPMFSGARDRFLTAMLYNFAPEIGEQAAWWFQYLARTAAETTAVGAGALVVTAILLLATIEDHLQVVWHVSVVRAWHKRVLAYWMVLTLGPVLIGIGFSLPGYLDVLSQQVGANAAFLALTTESWFGTLARVVSFVLEMAAFALLYGLIPNCRVRWYESVAGAILAAALMEILKIAYAVFITQASSYGTVYGALAGIPIFLLWMYIFWAVVLVGAEVAAGLRHQRIADDPGGE
jgi:membrane protein